MISIRFKLEKLVHALAFFSDAGVADLTKLKAAKLLYLADKAHLLQYGRPILGDIYFCLPYGPVPSVALNEMSDAIERAEVEDADRNVIRQYLDVKKPFWSPRYPVFRAKHGYDPDVFSDSEMDVLRSVAEKYGRSSARQLVELTHADATWKIANQTRCQEGRTLIPYELFFADAPEDARPMLDLFRAECKEASELDAILNQNPRQSLVNA